MKKIFISIAAITMALSVQAQSSLDVRLNHKAKVFEMQRASAAKGAVAPVAETVTVIATLKDGVLCPTEELNALGVQVKNQYYGMVVMKVTVDQLEALGKVSAFKVINASNKVSERNNVSHQLTHVDLVQDESQRSETGLSQEYTGKDVIVGVIDGGFDFQHITFKDASDQTKTRIQKIWVIGTEDKLEEQDIASATTDKAVGSHGCHVAGTAAGSYNGEYTRTDGTKVSGMRGAAYESDILFSAYSTDEVIQDAVNKMWDYAKTANKPLVVNMSLGGNDAWMDGKNVWTTYLKGVTNNGDQAGLLINIAAGNEGNDHKSFYKEMAAGSTLETGLVFDTKKAGEIMICSEDATPFDVTIYELDDNGNHVGNEYTLNSDTEGSTVWTGLTYTRGTSSEHDGRYYYLITGTEGMTLPTASGYSIQIKTPSDKAVKVRYNSNDITCTNKVGENTVSAFFLPNDDNSLNNMIQCKYAFAVGAYTSTKSVVLLDGENTKDADGGEVGSFANFSSWVETPYQNDTENIGIDFLSPGSIVVSSVNHYNTGNEEVVAKNDVNWIGAMEGTSMATPNATGIMALWLQADKTLTINKVRSIINETADNDSYTQADKRRAGAGRINCLKGLQKILNLTAINAIQSNDSNVAPVMKKVLKNGQFIIIKDGKQYNAAGQQM